MNQQALHRIWYEGRPPGAALRALEALYRWGSARRRARAARAAQPSLQGLPIIVVGNITAGGTGKTPLVLRLCQLFGAAGLAPAVISRGYGRRSRGALTVGPDTPASEAGDEAALVARRCRVPVYVDANREAAAQRAFAAGAGVVIADDGLQRLSLPRAVEICVVDASRGFGNGHLLPAGPLREPPERLDSVDYVVWNGDIPSAAGHRHKALAMQLRAAGLHHLETGAEADLAHIKCLAVGRQVHAVAGIGNPQRFFDSLQQLGLEPDHCHCFADHHAYTAADFEGLEGVLLMTEKDAVKCAGLLSEAGIEHAYSLRVEAQLPAGFEQELLGRVRALAAEQGG